MESTTYKHLDDIISNSIDSSGKVLVFTDLKKDVISNLMKRYSNLNPLCISGDVSAISKYGEESEREQIRKKFQKSSDNRILFATSVMNEGVDLTAATDIVHLTLPYNYSTLQQRDRRSQRINAEVKKDEVRSHLLIPTMSGGITSITEGIYRLMEEKKRITHFVMTSPHKLSKQDLEEIKTGLTSSSKSLSPMIKSPDTFVRGHWAQLKGAGFQRIQEHYEKSSEAETIARLYANNWEGFYGGNTGIVYGEVIKAIAKKHSLDNILDIGSGPFSLSRTIQKPATNVDINPNMLQAGRDLEEKGLIVKGNISLEGLLHELPVKSENFDLAVCSLALHYTKLKVGSGKNVILEREKVFREMNRSLKIGGYGIFTLPYSTILESDFENLSTAMQHLGFEYLPFSGFYLGKDSNSKDKSFKVFLAGLRKLKPSNEESLDSHLLEWQIDRKKKRFFGPKQIEKRKGAKRKVNSKPTTRQEIEELHLSSHANESIEETVLKCI